MELAGDYSQSDENPISFHYPNTPDVPMSSENILPVKSDFDIDHKNEDLVEEMEMKKF